jgi:hypothetical protein
MSAHGVVSTFLVFALIYTVAVVVGRLTRHHAIKLSAIAWAVFGAASGLIAGSIAATLIGGPSIWNLIVGALVGLAMIPGYLFMGKGFSKQ